MIRKMPKVLRKLLLTLLIIFFMITFFIILVRVLIDLFRSKDLSGGAKAGWLIVIVILPFVGLFIYLIVRGQGMAEREFDVARENQRELDEHIRETAGSRGATAEIAKGKKLLDSGAITQEEFDAIKKQHLS